MTIECWPLFIHHHYFSGLGIASPLLLGRQLQRRVRLAYPFHLMTTASILHGLVYIQKFSMKSRRILQYVLHHVFNSLLLCPESARSPPLREKPDEEQDQFKLFHVSAGQSQMSPVTGLSSVVVGVALSAVLGQRAHLRWGVWASLCSYQNGEPLWTKSFRIFTCYTYYISPYC